MIPAETWNDLRERLERAQNELLVMADANLDNLRRAHLRSKAEGVNLALSYMREYGVPSAAITSSGPEDRFTGHWLELAALVEWMDTHLDDDVADTYQGQPLAQDWARVAKVTEEAGEAIDALIGITGQNPRKGHYGTEADLHSELLDVALTGLYALQHFTKDINETMGQLIARARHHHERVSNGSEGSG